MAGLRGMSISSPGRKGFGTPFRAGLAGRVTHFIFNKPGRVNSPTARFFMCLSIKMSSSSRTAATSFFPTFAFLAISFKISVLVYFFCIAGTFLAAVFRGVLRTAMPNLF